MIQGTDNQNFIRNFCIIAHIDHGKSTLADRLLEMTGAVTARNLLAQHLDSMSIERERGITIKAAAARLTYFDEGQEFTLNLIDTPGHVDFGHEVLRSISTCEGALLIVDATQGVQAQTLANTWLAIEHGLDIIPVLNKMDVPSAEPDRVMGEMEKEFGFKPDEILKVSAKTGDGFDQLIHAIVERIRPPSGCPTGKLRAVIFDSVYDSYRGVVVYVRVVDGILEQGKRLRLMNSDKETISKSTGYFLPAPVETSPIYTGEVGFVVTGIKRIKDVQVGDTITLVSAPAAEPLPNLGKSKPTVYSGVYPTGGSDYSELRDALDRLKLTDASVVYEPESSTALGFGFRCGFLGTLHMEVVAERLEREYGVSVILTAPSVEYQVLLSDGSDMMVGNPSKMPDFGRISEVREPWVAVSIIVPSKYTGTVMELLTNRRGKFIDMEYLQSESTYGLSRESRVVIRFEAPLAEIIADFHDSLKSSTSGHASMDYRIVEMRQGSLVKLDVLVNKEHVDAFSVITHRDSAQHKGRELVGLLKELIPRQMFEVPIQAAIGGRILARENIKALRKNVLAKCYGGDVTRKRKLLERQAEGKKKMKMIGRVEVPQEAFMAVLKLGK